jgi:hypothetical protein
MTLHEEKKKIKSVIKTVSVLQSGCAIDRTSMSAQLPCNCLILALLPGII